MKPTVKEAMSNLIREAREKLPFNLSFSGNCIGRCEECPEKLLEYLDMDLSNWQSRLEHGEVPHIDQVYALARDCKEIHGILCKKGLIP
jgi:hypothetical protein